MLMLEKQQKEIMTLVDILGAIAAACTTGAFLPQAIKVIVTQETKSLSLIMYIMLTTGVALWLAYGILKADIPLIIANGVTFAFASIILIIKIKNKD
jgi:MtN3 and saliva related transmembrane protein